MSYNDADDAIEQAISAIESSELKYAKAYVSVLSGIRKVMADDAEGTLSGDVDAWLSLFGGEL